MPVVGHFDREWERFYRSHCSLGGADQFDRRRLIRGVVGRSAPIFLIDGRIDFAEGHQRSVRFFRTSMGGQRPHELLLAPILWDPHFEDVLLSSQIKVRRLPTINAWLERVVRPDWDVEFLVVIPVQVTEDYVEAAVGHSFPALENRNDILADGILDLTTRWTRHEHYQAQDHCDERTLHIRGAH